MDLSQLTDVFWELTENPYFVIGLIAVGVVILFIFKDMAQGKG